MQTLIRGVLAASAVAVLAGCPPEQACTLIAVWSVNLDVVDEAGAPIPDATATWSVDGGSPEPCEVVGDILACGSEIAGDLTIEAAAPGFESQSTTVTVGADECHVITEMVELTLLPIACTLEARPSVEVTVASAGMGPLENVAVTYAVNFSAAQPCSGSGESWTCGEEMDGELLIEATADGHVPASETVTVERTEDLCHVITEQVAFTLEEAP